MASFLDYVNPENIRQGAQNLFENAYGHVSDFVNKIGDKVTDFFTPGSTAGARAYVNFNNAVHQTEQKLGLPNNSLSGSSIQHEFVDSLKDVGEVINNLFTGDRDYERQKELMQMDYDHQKEMRDTQISSAAKQYADLGLNTANVIGSGGGYSVSGGGGSSANPGKSGQFMNTILNALVTMATSNVTSNAKVLASLITANSPRVSESHVYRYRS